VADGTHVGPLSTTDGFGATDMTAPAPHAAPPLARRRTQDLLRCGLGIPALLLMHALPYVPLTFLLEAGPSHCSLSLRPILSRNLLKPLRENTPCILFKPSLRCDYLLTPPNTASRRIRDARK